jgi:hypothetical protein
MAAAIDAELVETSALTVAPAASVSLGNLRGANGSELVQSASDLATTLADIINQRALYKTIQGRDYVLCEGWTTLATLCGLMPREVACENLEGVYVAVVSLVRISDGVELTRASAECGGDGDETWQKRPAYARRSMAITRATSKACRIALSWIMHLAGYQVTPAEEMEAVEREARERAAEKAKQPPAPEKPLAKPRMIGKTDRKIIFGKASDRAKLLGDPSITAETIVRDIAAAWALPPNAKGVPSTEGIPAKLAPRFMELVDEWQPGVSAGAMPEMAEDF